MASLDLLYAARKLYVPSSASLQRKQRPEIYYRQQDSRFSRTNAYESSRITLTNTGSILIRPYKSTTLPLGLFLEKSNGLALLLIGRSENKKVVCHVGLIDPNYTGEIKIILFNNSDYNGTLYPGDLIVSIIGLHFYCPVILNSYILCQPQYVGDAGFDVKSPLNFMLFPFLKTKVTINEEPPIKDDLFVPIILGRSGLAKQGIKVIPKRWTSEGLRLTIINYGRETKEIRKGERVCQVVFIRKDHVSKSLHFWQIMRLGTIALKGANVSFIDVNNDHLASLVTLSSDCGNESSRGNNGFGSSGQF